MASLYSRYIPPSKKSTPSTPQKSSTIVESQITPSIEPAIPTPPPTVADASATYTRYVPPLKTKIPSHSKPVEPITEQSTPQSTKRKHEEVVEHEPAQNSKKSKKSKSEENEGQTAEDIDEQPESPIKPKKAKKEKKKKVSEEEADETEEAEGDKHRALLAKREKSLRKAEKLARKAKEAEAEAEGTEPAADEEPIELHALEPLPQPEPLPEPSGISAFSALPSWLASPIRISPTTTADFSDLGLEEAAAKILQTKGFNQAFAVQAAVLPLLLPGPQQQPGDVLVSAATGSGKTLSYVLPMVRDLSSRTATKLRGLIVMPTRELVSQARDVCEICATAFSGNNGRRVKIGTAIGSQALKTEQSLLMDAEQVYDPEEYRKRESHRNAKWENSSEVGMDDDEDLYEDAEIAMPDHIIKPISKVDILICTPGRLVEHLKSTPGFTLDFVNWLVIDEADKLLDQSFQQWIGTVMGGLPQQKLLAKSVRSSEDLGITKIILSATLTKDIGQLNSLKLRRPKLVILEGSETEEMEGIETEQGLALPATLHESAIKVDEEGEKPLYLVDLLQSKVVVTPSAASDTSSEDSDSSSDSTSSDEDSDDTSSDDSSSDSDSSSSSDNDSDVSMADAPATNNAIKLSKATGTPLTKAALSEPHGVLIFTKSNESAVRLSRLLALIKPSFASSIGTLTSTIRNSARKHTLGAFHAGKLSILVASDLVSRGLDLPNLAHVINYDIPTSLTSYVHRVGRTARAGKEGHAWTLFTNTEGRWFWNEIARADLVKRSADKKVVRMRIDAESFGDDLKTRYEEALQILSQEASGEKRA